MRIPAAEVRLRIPEAILRKLEGETICDRYTHKAYPFADPRVGIHTYVRSSVSDCVRVFHVKLDQNPFRFHVKHLSSLTTLPYDGNIFGKAFP